VVTVGEDQNGDPIFADDGTKIDWRVVGPNGTIAEQETVTRFGFSSNVLTTSTLAGETYQVFAKVVELVVGTQHFQLASEEVQTPTLTVHPGAAAAFTFGVSDNRIPADENTTTTVTMTAQDAAGNLVADDSEVNWNLDGLGEIVQADDTLIGGIAQAIVEAAYTAGTTNVAATVDNHTEQTKIEMLPINIQLTHPPGHLDATSGQLIPVFAVVKDSDGNFVPNGTPIRWFAQKGTFLSKDGVVFNGQARAILKAAGGAETVGKAMVSATIADNVGQTFVNFLRPRRRGWVALDHPILIGDSPNDQTVRVQQEDGSFLAYNAHAITIASITGGKANEQVTVQLGDYVTPASPFLQIGRVLPNGRIVLLPATQHPDTNPIVSLSFRLNANGNGRFAVASRGTMNTPAKLLRSFPLTVSGAKTDFGLPLSVMLERTDLWATEVDYVSTAVGDILSGVGDSSEAAVADMTLNASPGIGGVIFNLRDLAIDILNIRHPGQDRNWTAIALGAVGVGFSLDPDPVSRAALATAKTVVRNLTHDGALLKIAAEAIRKLDLPLLVKSREIFTKMVHDSEFLKLVDTVLVKSENGFQSLLSLVERIGADETATVLKQTAADFGKSAAKKVTEVLAALDQETLNILKTNNKLGVVAEGVGKLQSQGFGWGASQVKKYAQAVQALGRDSQFIRQFERFSGVKGSGRWIERNLVDEGVQFEITTANALQNAGDDVIEVSRQLKGQIKGDVDVITKSRVVEVKGERFPGPTEIPIGEFLKKLDNFEAQLDRLVAVAQQEGKAAAIKLGHTLPAKFLETVTSRGIEILP
jgi:hypothetical protein